MIRIMLVDDEPFIRVAIKALFDWKENGFEIVSEANNGETALLKLKYERPDLIITDIKMPIKNGIDLIREVHKLYPEIKCVVLSNYGDFELTRSAFLEGAVDYLLKNDLSRDSFLSLVQRLKKNFFSGTTEDIEIEKNHSHSVSNSELLHALLHGEKQEAEQIAALTNGLPYVIGVVCPFLASNLSSGPNSSMICETILKIISEISEFPGCAYADSPNHYVLLICNNEENPSSFFEKLRSFLHSLCTNIQIYMNTFTTVGISGMENNIENLPAAYACAMQLSENRFYDKENTFYFYSQTGTPSRNMNTFVSDNLNELTMCISQKNWTGINALFSRLCEVVKVEKFPPDKLKRLVINLMFLMQGEILRHHPEESEIFHDNGLLDQILVSESMDELENCINQVLELFQEKSDLLMISSKKFSPIITQTIYYLHKNFQNPDTNLTTVAKEIAVNQSYLSRLFFKETGVHFNTYLVHLKLDFAKNLLLSTTESVSIIAEKSGFGNPKYFINVFKKSEKLTPSAFRATGGDVKGRDISLC